MSSLNKTRRVEKEIQIEFVVAFEIAVVVALVIVVIPIDGGVAGVRMMTVRVLVDVRPFWSVTTY